MFSKTSTSGGNRNGHAASTKAAVPSVLSADLKIVGNLSSEGEIHIDGTVEGDIRARILLIGETATIHGQIEAQSVTVHGAVFGQIRARAVNLARTARVTGDVHHETLAIDNGAYLEGHCRRLDRKSDGSEGKVAVVRPAIEPVPAKEPKSRSATAASNATLPTH